MAGSQKRDLLIAGGSPGIGCPVIAFITGAQMAQVHGRSVVENGDRPAAREIRALWERVRDAIA